MKKSNIVPGSVFRDCTHSDFEHYFANTILLWNLSPTKRRIFVCGGINSVGVYGQYLTRQKELKDKNFSLSSWWENLDVLPPYSKVFNLAKTAAMWLPNMTKNLKKSFPRISENSLQNLYLVGKPTAEESTLQNILAYAFDEFYMFRSLPTLAYGLSMIKSEGRTSVACQGDLVINGITKSILFKSSSNVVAQIGEDRKIVAKDANIKELLVDVGQLPPETVVLSAKTI